jgi:hypothetical protein
MKCWWKIVENIKLDTQIEKHFWHSSKFPKLLQEKIRSFVFYHRKHLIKIRWIGTLILTRLWRYLISVESILTVHSLVKITLLHTCTMSKSYSAYLNHSRECWSYALHDEITILRIKNTHSLSKSHFPVSMSHSAWFKSHS